MLPMPLIAMLSGGFLMALGVIAYAAPDILGGNSPYSISALSPAFIGLPLEILGALSISMPHLRKHFMHFAAMLGLFGTVGGLVPCVLKNFDFSYLQVKVGLGMTVISAIFLILCVKSFIDARKARQAAETIPPVR